MEFISKLKRLIDSHQIISFDIFDTLIIRSYSKPVDLFRHIELSLKIKNFSQIRQEAEAVARADARAKDRDEVTLDEIYLKLPNKFHYLKDVEIKQELLCCSRDEYMYEVFEYAKQQRKTIIITSEMYLPLDVISKILHNAGYSGYQELFLSSDWIMPARVKGKITDNSTATEIKKLKEASFVLHNKGTGMIYEDILCHFQCQPNEILHIGDNLGSDIGPAAAFNIDTYHYKTAKYYLRHTNEKMFELLDRHAHDSLEISILSGLLVKRSFKSIGTWQDFGYLYGGLAMVGFCQWIKEQCDKNGIVNIIFVARDGYLPKKIFDSMYARYQTSYKHSSRRAFIFGAFDKWDDMATYFINMIGEGMTFKQYWSSLLLDSKQLRERFEKEFDLNSIIMNYDHKKIEEFFETNNKEFMLYAKSEKKLISAYLRQEKIGTEDFALVDVGWRGTMQQSVQKILHKSNLNPKILGLYLGTHLHDPSPSPMLGFLVEEELPLDRAETVYKCIDVIELLLSAPHCSCAKFTQGNNLVEPIFTKLTGEEEHRFKAIGEIEEGVAEFVNDFSIISQDIPLSISPVSICNIYHNFFENINKDTFNLFSKLQCVTLMGDAENFKPVLPTFAPNSVIGVVYTWPGVNVSGEAEFIRRFLNVQVDGYTIVPIDQNGYILDHIFRRLGFKIPAECFKFVIYPHYEDIKVLDCFSYFTVWNPPAIPLNIHNHDDIVFRIRQHDDYLTYEDGWMLDYIKAVSGSDEKSFVDNSFFSASCSKHNVRPVTAKTSYSLLYCGINWENLIGIPPRHSGLFSLLDKRSDVDFFGRKDGWRDYKNYKGSIPFDGVSIIDEISNCGAMLALSSECHYKSGAASNRVYEGCAAGAVIISDRNPFIVKHFGETILYIDFNLNNPLMMYTQIAKHLDWMNNNPQDAQALATKAQHIFTEKFTLELQLGKIIEKHSQRVEVREKSIYDDHCPNILAVAFFDDYEFSTRDEQKIKQIINNISNQQYPATTLVIISDAGIREHLSSYIKSLSTELSLQIESFDFFDHDSNKIFSRYQALRHVMAKYEHDYFCLMSGNEVMFKHHLGTLKNALDKNTNAFVAYSALIAEDVNGYARIKSMTTWAHQHIYDFVFQMMSTEAAFLLRKEAADYIPLAADRFIDGHELPALLNASVFNAQKEMVDTRQLTLKATSGVHGMRDHTISLDQQKKLIHSLVRDGFEKWLDLSNSRHAYFLIDEIRHGGFVSAAPILNESNRGDLTESNRGDLTENNRGGFTEFERFLYQGYKGKMHLVRIALSIIKAFTWNTEKQNKLSEHLINTKRVISEINAKLKT